MSPWSIFITLVGVVGSLLTIYEFIRSRQRPGKAGNRQLAIIFGIVTLALIVVSVILPNLVPSLRNPGISTAPTQTSNTSPLGSEITPVQKTSSPIPSPTPTLVPKPVPGTVLCQADASQGWNGWNGTSDWKVFNGMLLNDGTNDMPGYYQRHPTIVAPCQLNGIPNYAVEVKMQVTSFGSDACFGIYVRGMSTGDGWQGYAAVIDKSCYSSPRNIVRISTDQDQQGFQWLTTAPFDPGNNYHTYRLDVNGTSINFFIDGGSILQVNDNKYLSGGQVGLWNSGFQLSVSNFKIITL